eukprot:5357976-Prymnesium_polylepis.1
MLCRVLAKCEAEREARTQMKNAKAKLAAAAAVAKQKLDSAAVSAKQRLDNALDKPPGSAGATVDGGSAVSAPAAASRQPEVLLRRMLEAAGAEAAVEQTVRMERVSESELQYCAGQLFVL